MVFPSFMRITKKHYKDVYPPTSPYIETQWIYSFTYIMNMWKGFVSVPTWKEIPITHRWMSTVHSETWWWEHKTHGYHFCCNISFTNSKPLFHFYTWWNMRCSCVFFWILVVVSWVNPPVSGCFQSCKLATQAQKGVITQFWNQLHSFFPHFFKTT